ncbi:MAG: glycosyltransferase family 39 protein [Desulfatiglandales bacterium]
MTVKYRTKWKYSILAIVITMGLAARFHGIDYNLDGDEIFSIQLASKPFTEVISASLKDTPHPPLHNILLHFWIKVFGASEASVRALSILFSSAFLLLSYRFIRRFVSPWLALGMLSILALSPFFVYYGQQARPYALIAFLSIVNLLAFMRLIEQAPNSREIVIWAASCGFLLYAQYLAVLLIAFQIGFALFYLQAGRVKLLAYGSVAIATIVPWTLVSFGDAIIYATDPLPSISWIGQPTPIDFALFYLSVFGDSSVIRACWVLIILAVLGIAYIRQLVTLNEVSYEHVFLLLIGFVMPIVVYIISVWGPKPVFASRQLLVCAIAFVAMIGLCIATLPTVWATLSLMILLGLTIAGIPDAFPRNTKPPWREVATLLDTQYGSTVVLVQENWVGRPLSYYRKVGSVRLWDEVEQNIKKDRFLFVCRPFRCSNIQTKTLPSRRSLLMTWRWGRSRKYDEKYTQLRLYEIRRAQ